MSQLAAIPVRSGVELASRRFRRARSAWLLACFALAAGLIAGCRPAKVFYFHESNDVRFYKDVATSLEYPDVASTNAAPPSLPPRTLWNHETTEYWELSLEEAIQLALANSQVMRDLGGRVVSSPDLARTNYDPAIQETDPRFGVDGALSHFDAVLASGVFWEKNDRVFNNLLLGGGIREFQQDRGVYRTEVRKRSAAGSLFAVRHNVDYDANNAPFNLFPSAWNTNIEAEVRQPLLQGAGLAFNRIAGPDARPGFYYQNGVLLARVDTDISLTEFEEGVRNLVNDVENAYWDLYLAYRDLDAKVEARDNALRTWRMAKELLERGGRQGTAANESQAAAQYFAFRAEVENAISGRAGAGTRGGVGSRSGNLLQVNGLYAAESNLRLLIGLTENDGRLLRPANEPASARVAFDWEQVINEALVRRVELRRQKWRIKRRELEVVASRNFIKPRLDAVGLYRWRGFGDQLIDSDGGQPQFDNAAQDLTDGNFQEWQLGLQYEVPLGMREGYAGLRNAQLKLTRERRLLEEQERQISHDLAAAMREVHRAYAVTQTALNARERARDHVDAVLREFEGNRPGGTLDRVLAAQQAKAEADATYYRSIVEYNLAVKAVHFEKGSLLDHCSVFLTEGPWPGKAYDDAHRRARQRSAATPIDYRMTVPGVISRGEVVQHFETPEMKVETVPAGSAEPNLLPQENHPAELPTPDQPDAPATRHPESSRRLVPTPPATQQSLTPRVQRVQHLEPLRSGPATATGLVEPNLLRLPPVDGAETSRINVLRNPPPRR